MHKVKTQLLYKGRTKIDFHYDDENESVHYYTKHGSKAKLLGVTTVANSGKKDGLVYWAVNCACNHLLKVLNSGAQITARHIEEARKRHEVERDEAASIGKKVHKWCENHVKGIKQDMPTDPSVLNGVVAFLQWVEEHHVLINVSEQIVYSRRHGYVGTLDAEGFVDGKFRLIDFKTSKPSKTSKSGVYKEHRYQVAAYRAAREEEGIKYEADPIIARFDKETGNFETYTIGNSKKDQKAFLGLLAAEKRRKEIGNL